MSDKKHRRRRRVLRNRATVDQNSGPPKIERLAISDVMAHHERRKCRHGEVEELARSFEEIGQSTPIIVRRNSDGKLILVAGLHRLKAAKRLGSTEIDARIVRGDKVDVELVAIAENLHRNELTVLERAEWVRKWGELVQKKHKSEDAGRKPTRSNRANIDVDYAGIIPGKTKEARRKAKKCSDKIAKLKPKVKEAAKKAGVDDNQSALLETAKQPTTLEQIEKIKEIAKQRKKRAQGSAKDTTKTKIALAKDQTFKLKRAWDQTSPEVRLMFTAIFIRRSDEYRRLEAV
jgi:ParB family chromosome partitioning protein